MRHLTDGKNTAQEPRPLEDQESEEDDADSMGLTREEVEDIYHTLQSGDSMGTYKQMDDDKPHHRFMGMRNCHCLITEGSSWIEELFVSTSLL